MQRQAFLSCQPYLYPLSSSSLPGDHGSSSSNDTDGKYSREVLLDNLNLSIEPCENTSYVQDTNDNGNKKANSPEDKKNKMEEHSAGPAFFAANNPTTANDSTNSGYSNDGDKQVDPSVCKVQLILHTFGLPPKGMTTPIKKSNRRDLSELEDRVARNDETILIAKIDGNHFQVDLNQLCSIRVGETHDGNKTDSSSKSLPFLILEMPSCCFRIFAIDSSTTNDNSVLGGGSFSLGMDDDKIKLDCVRDRLERLLSGDSLLPFPLSYSGRITPRDGDENHSDKQDEGDAMTRVRQCLRSYSQAWNDIIAFDQVLENTHAAGSTRAKMFQDTVKNLMSRIPEQVSSSFIQENDLAKAVEMHENKIAASMEEFDGVMGTFWNEKADHKRNNKRQREEDDTTTENTQSDCVARFDDILRDHKKQVGSKHELFLLPIRGS